MGEILRKESAFRKARGPLAQLVRYYLACLQAEDDNKLALLDGEENQSWIRFNRVGTPYADAAGVLRFSLDKTEEAVAFLEAARRDRKRLVAALLVSRVQIGARRAQWIPMSLCQARIEVRARCLEVLIEGCPQQTPAFEEHLSDSLLAERVRTHSAKAWAHALAEMGERETRRQPHAVEPLVIPLALMALETQKYNAGLRRELEALAAVDADKLARSAVGPVMLGQEGHPGLLREDELLLEPFALNAAQREALECAFTEPLTVVTGPPGTGKSQIIRAAVANAILKGRRVLFASQNHKALDDVEKWLAEVSDTPLVLRVGRIHGRRNLRKEMLAALRAWWRGRWDPARVRDVLGTLVFYEKAATLLAAESEAQALGKSVVSNPKIIVNLEAQTPRMGRKLLEGFGTTMAGALTHDEREALDAYQAILTTLSQGALKGSQRRAYWHDAERLFEPVSRVFPVWLSTALSVSSGLPLKPGLFDLVIIDEASQASIPATLPLLYRARRALVVGDDRQLTHVSSLSEGRSRELRETAGLGEPRDIHFDYVVRSIFARARAARAVKAVFLAEHYRCHPEIAGFFSAHFYEDGLAVRTQTPQPEGLPFSGLRWQHIEGTTGRGADGGFQNHAEADAAVSILQRLAAQNVACTVGLVTPFRAQSRLLQRLCRERLPQDWARRASLTIGTVHALQGDERDLVLFSTCLGEAGPAGVGRFLGRSENLVNVACSRGRHGFLALGHRAAAQACGVRSIEAMVDYAQERETVAAEAALAEASADTVGPGEGRLLVGLEKQGLRPLPQHPIGAYKVDLALAWRDGGLVVEVDGRHGHRNGAGEVILDDRIRDRALTNMGWAVVRVAHSEVMASPDACAARIARRFDELRRGPAEPVP